MSEPLVIVDTSRIRSGKMPEVEAGFAELSRFVEANEPRALAYNVYVDPVGMSVTVFQVHPDSSSAEFHMTVAADMFKPFAGLLELEGIDVYGQPSDELLTGLRRKGELLGSGRLVVHELHAGFTRFESVAVESSGSLPCPCGDA